VKGEIIAEYPGDLIHNRQEADAREQAYSESGIASSYMFKIQWKGNSYWYDPSFILVTYIFKLISASVVYHPSWPISGCGAECEPAYASSGPALHSPFSLHLNKAVSGLVSLYEMF
jgi:hypothetical protein